MVAVESVAAALATAAWALAAAHASRREIFVAFVVAGFVAVGALVATQKEEGDTTIRKGVAGLLALILVVYQSLLALAFAADGARAQAVVNLNVVVVVAVTAWMGERADVGMAFAMIVYAVLGLYASGFIKTF